jgi:hypothetical protein
MDRLGTIVAFDQQYLKVRFDGAPRSIRLHPTWEVEYLRSRERDAEKGEG